MKVLSLFSGIGAFEKALKNLSVGYELVNYCEIDKYASKSYSVIHGVPEDKNLGDITKVNTSTLPNDIDLITYGFPCQDISQAGKQKGFTDENGEHTRSGLFFEALRIIQDTKPKYAIAENVKALTSKKFANEFKTVLESLEQAGYNNYYDVLNAKDYGIPQNRERVFIVSIRKDIDDNSFVFPQPFELKTRLKDLLEDEVDSKYYLSEKIQQRLQITDNTYTKDVIGTTKPEFRTIGQRDLVFNPNGVMGTFVATDHKQPKQILEPKCIRVGGLYDTEKSKHQAGAIYDANGISPALDTCQGGNRMPQIVCNTERMTKQAYETLQENECKAGDVINPFNKKVVNSGLCPTLTTRPEGFKTANLIVTEKTANSQPFIIDDTQGFDGARTYTDYAPTLRAARSGLKTIEPINLRIRKLTPLECWRLMGFDDEDIDKCIAAGLSNSQLYKQAGNSIVVNCIEEIYKRLFKE